MIDVRSTPEEPLGFLNDWDMAEWQDELLSAKASQHGFLVSHSVGLEHDASLITVARAHGHSNPLWRYNIRPNPQK